LSAQAEALAFSFDKFALVHEMQGKEPHIDTLFVEISLTVMDKYCTGGRGYNVLREQPVWV
jgi:hypothetical protein